MSRRDGHTSGNRRELAIDLNNNSIRYAQVEISGSNIRGIEKGGALLTIRREEIRRIRLCYGTEAHNPFFQYFVGFILFFLGLLGLAVTFFALAAGGGMAPVKPGEFVIPLVPIALWLMTGIGFWLLLGIFRARYTLCIDTDSAVRGVVFAKTAKAMEIRQFLRRANLKFGYEIDLSLLPQTPGTC